MLSKLISFLFDFKSKKSASKVITRKNSRSYINHEIRLKEVELYNKCLEDDVDFFTTYFSRLKGLNVKEREISCYRRIF